MKKAVLASAVLAALVSTSTLAATVYKDETSELKIGGRAEARFNVSDNNEEYDSTTGDQTGSKFDDKSRARLSISGKTKISEGLTGFGKYENEVSSGSDIKTRYVFAGIGTQIGDFSYGKQDTALVMITDFTDTMATFGADADDALSLNAGADKQENNFAYKGEFGGLTVGANYLASEEVDSDQYSLGAKYSFDFGLDLGAGYAGGKSADNDVSQVDLGAQYSIADFTFGALYQMTTDDGANGDNDGYEVSAQYKFEQWTFVGVYNYATGNDGDDDAVDNFALEGVYKFNSNLRTYVGYKFEQIDNQDDRLQAGIRYDF
ncbi:porin [Vibrio sp. S17_S38]|uniref:porin n=1 Tax=Vibrio sp. S17_S38 TaxID=2720229 RepID=UPI0016814195|nr:porin [Vibrio sp. S17_S38]MBD1572228.1 porin [Vibrio sp. S17_S38]